MTVLEPDHTTASTTAVFSAATLRSIRRLIVWALITAAAYSAFTRGSRSLCVGGVDCTGGFVDAGGRSTDAAPLCHSLQLAPSPLVLVAFAVVVIVAFNRVLARATGDADAARILDRAALLVIAIGAASCVIGIAWFSLLPLQGWVDGAPLYFPFPFASVTTDVSPMPTQ